MAASSLSSALTTRFTVLKFLRTINSSQEMWVLVFICSLLTSRSKSRVKQLFKCAWRGAIPWCRRSFRVSCNAALWSSPALHGAADSSCHFVWSWTLEDDAIARPNIREIMLAGQGSEQEWVELEKVDSMRRQIWAGGHQRAPEEGISGGR